MLQKNIIFFKFVDNLKPENNGCPLDNSSNVVIGNEFFTTFGDFRNDGIYVILHSERK